MFLSGGAGFQSTKVIARSCIGRSKHLNRQHVLRARLGRVRHIELVRTPRSRNVVIFGNLLPVQPDVGPVVDAVELQPDRLAFIGRWHRKLSCGTATTTA